MSQEYISCFFLVMILNFSSSVSSDTFEIPFNISTVLSNFKLRGVYRIVHKKLERKCERKACKYKEFERFEGDLGKKNEMYTGLICFNLV